jgi:hypothetical protein
MRCLDALSSTSRSLVLALTKNDGRRRTHRFYSERWYARKVHVAQADVIALSSKSSKR